MRTLIIQPWLILSSLVSTIIYLTGALISGAFDLRLWPDNLRLNIGVSIAISCGVLFVGVVAWATGERLNLEDDEND